MVSRFRKWECEALRTGQRQARQLVVAVTANGAECGLDRRDSGFDNVCPKPLDKMELFNIVIRYVENSKIENIKFDNTKLPG